MNFPGLAKKIVAPLRLVIGRLLSCRVTGGRLRQMVRLMRRARSQNSVIFLAPYPGDGERHDGYMQRVAALDTLWPDRHRIYCHFMARWDGTPLTREIDGNLTVLRPVLDNPPDLLFFLGLAWWVGRVYIHSIHVLQAVCCRWMLRLSGLHKTLDLHGAVPEEARAYQAADAAERFRQIEAYAVRHCDLIVVVSKAMRAHLMNKYRFLAEANFAVLPILPIFTAPPVGSAARDLAYGQGKPVVVYAGGMQPWQQIPMMFDFIAASVDRAHWRIYIPDVEEARRLLPPPLREHPSVILASLSPAELRAAYSECHFGLIFREDSVVNRVACPTKLVEYLIFGIIPVLSFAQLGDFSEAGLRYVHRDDFKAGRLPGPAERIRMAEENFRIYVAMAELADQARLAIRQAHEPGETGRDRPAGLHW